MKHHRASPSWSFVTANQSNVLAQKHPTILQIIPELETGGAELSTVEIANAVTSAGGRAIVLSEGGRLAPRITACGAEFIPFPAATKNPIKILSNAGKIAKLIRQEGVSLVHARSRAPAWSALIAARRTNTPFVTTYHGAYNEKGPIKRSYNSVMARGDIVIANSRYTADLIKNRYGTAEEIIRVIYRGVDEDSYDPAKITSARTDGLRKSWGIAPEDRVILHPARLTGWKGQTIVIEAAHALKSGGALNNATIILAGDAQGRSGYVQELEQQIAKYGLSSDVRIVGHVDDMPAAYHTAYFTLVASTEPEAFGRTAAEAQAMTCPVIATRIGAPQETVLAPPATSPSEQTGWLVPPGDAESLATAIGEALSLTPIDRTNLGERARSHVLSTFTLTNMCTQTLAVYDEVLRTAAKEEKQHLKT